MPVQSVLFRAEGVNADRGAGSLGKDHGVRSHGNIGKVSQFAGPTEPKLALRTLNTCLVVLIAHQNHFDTAQRALWREFVSYT